MRFDRRQRAPETDPDVLDLDGAAREAGVHYDTLKKHWRRWCDPTADAYCGFPPPFRYPEPGQRGRVAWRATAVADWKLRREHAFGAGRAAPASHRPPGRPGLAAGITPRGAQLQRERAQLAQLMGVN